jgi:hypothetical protein
MTMTSLSGDRSTDFPLQAQRTSLGGMDASEGMARSAVGAGVVAVLRV